MSFNSLSFTLFSVTVILFTQLVDDSFWLDGHEIDVSAAQLEALSKIEADREKELDSLRKPLSESDSKLRATNHKFRETLFEYGNLLEEPLTPNQIEALNRERSESARRRGGEVAKFMRQFASFLDVVTVFEKISVFEGLPRAAAEELVEIKQNQKTIEYDGWSFYATPLQPSQSQIENLRSALTDYQEFRYHPENARGGKGCGGFHPDFYLRWNIENQVYHVLICLGCNELKFISTTAKTTFDFDDKAWQSFAQFAIYTFQFHQDGIKMMNDSRLK